MFYLIVPAMVVWLVLGLFVLREFEHDIGEQLDFETQALIVILFPLIVILMALGAITVVTENDED